MDRREARRQWTKKLVATLPPLVPAKARKEFVREFDGLSRKDRAQRALGEVVGPVPERLRHVLPERDLAGMLRAVQRQLAEGATVEALAEFHRLTVLVRGAAASAREAARRAQKMRAMPRWASRVAIEAKYEEAYRKTQETGQAWHVDHIVPLVSDVVCGLHCEANLRVIPWLENLKKGNKLIDV
jgi:hypothetical protein